MSLLHVRRLSIRERRTGRFLVQDLEFCLAPGACLGLVGESGSGKTLTCRALLGLLPGTLEVAGTAVFDGADLLRAKPETLRRIRGRRIAMVLQQPMTTFDPLYTIGAQFVETLREHTSCSAHEALETALRTLESVGIRHPEDMVAQYPHQLSGGTLQRCMIAIALALRPEILIADEPTTALDAVSQREVLEQFFRIRKQGNTAMVFISHDLGVVQALAQQLIIMKDGRCVEHGRADTVLHAPKHPYTRYLIHTRLSLTQSFEASMGRTPPTETKHIFNARSRHGSIL